MNLEDSSWQATQAKPSLYKQNVKHRSSNFKKATVAMNKKKKKDQWLIKALTFCSENHSSVSEQKRINVESSEM